MNFRHCARESFIPGTEVAPRSAEEIGNIMLKIRQGIAKDDEPIDIEKAIDYCTDLMDASYQIVPRNEFNLLPNSNHSEALWDGNTIYIPEDLEEKVGPHRARYTICHELAHMILGHKPQALCLGRGKPVPREHIPLFQDPEWQADKGASFLLMTFSGVENKKLCTPEDVSIAFNVSQKSARIFLQDYERVRKEPKRWQSR